jgi:hypothetical protein
MRFELSRLTENLIGHDELPKWILENFEPIPDDPQSIRLMTISILDWDDDQDQYVIIPRFEWLEKEMERINCVDVWICWYEENSQVQNGGLQEIIYEYSRN